jgi:predicted dehydrogenase
VVGIDKLQMTTTAKPIRTAIIGTGFMGRVHLEAVRRLECAEVVAIAGRNLDAARRLAAGFPIATITADYRDVLRDPHIDAVHICTPNAQHFSMVRDALHAGKHVVCEKPLATNVGDAAELVSLAARQDLRNCVCHNLRSYPMVQQMRSLREAGNLGEILIVQGTYFQDWLLYDTDWNWRIDRKAGGPSRVMADIGSHWFDMAEHVSGLLLTSLCADLQTFHAVRQKPKHAVETFAARPTSPDNYDGTAVNTEDFGAVLFHMGAPTRGSFTASQVSAGRKNRLSIEICGSKSSVAWNQERPDELWVGHRDDGNQILLKDPSLLAAEARTYADLPGGHSEGYDDTFKQIFRRFYASISAAGEARGYAQFSDGLRQLNILDAALKSNETRGWVDVPAPETKK